MAEKNTLSILETIKKKMNKIDSKPENGSKISELHSEFQYVSSTPIAEDVKAVEVKEEIENPKTIPVENLAVENEIMAEEIVDELQVEQAPIQEVAKTNSVEDFNFDDLDLDDEEKFSEQPQNKNAGEDFDEEDFEDYEDEVDFHEEEMFLTPTKIEEPLKAAEEPVKESAPISEPVDEIEIIEEEINAVSDEEQSQKELEVVEDDLNLDLEFDEKDLEEEDENLKIEEEEDENLEIEEETSSEEVEENEPAEEPEEESEEQKIEQIKEKEIFKNEVVNLKEEFDEDHEENIFDQELEGQLKELEEKQHQEQQKALQEAENSSVISPHKDEVDLEFEKHMMGIETEVVKTQFVENAEAETIQENIAQNSVQNNNQFFGMNSLLNQPIQSEQGNISTMNSPKNSVIYESTVLQVNDSVKKLLDAKNVVSGISTFSQGPAFLELATNLMEPKLEKWLNQNLPDLVEKIVREEIKKILPKD